MSKKYPPVIQHAPTLARNAGGWWCYYCGVALRPLGIDAPLGYMIVVGGYSYCQFYQLYGVDHIIPKTKGGGHDLSNLLLVCRTCNCRKSTRDYATFIQVIDRWIEQYGSKLPQMPIYKQP